MQCSGLTEMHTGINYGTLKSIALAQCFDLYFEICKCFQMILMCSQNESHHYSFPFFFLPLPFPFWFAYPE